MLVLSPQGTRHAWVGDVYGNADWRQAMPHGQVSAFFVQYAACDIQQLVPRESTVYVY